MRITCPHCHAEESRCPEMLPACRDAGIERRRLFAAANGNVESILRAENEALRARLFDYGRSIQDYRRAKPSGT